MHAPPTVAGGAARRLPLVVMLHGGFGSGRQAEQAYGWDAEADRHGYLVAYPDGIDHAWAAGGGCCGVPAATGVDDVGFVSAVVRELERLAPVDPGRVYVTGISNGGLLAYRLACDTTLFAAVAVDSATLLGPCPSPAPLSVLHLHGTADHNIPYQGGPGDGPARIDGPPVPQVLAAWRAVDHCPPVPAVRVGGPVTTTSSDCPDGRGVELITIDGAGHQWPGAVSHPVEERLLGLDPPSTALDATAVIRAFFDDHPGGARP
ncbi:PHB depolymerase family esterase [Kitasatospora nipponensis]|uniref:PHB depolymerase family esterase n=1 Tax=Kitasatospora nipponensis TaxID=258049 RepID=A0ABP4HP65_9ACTN